MVSDNCVTSYDLTGSITYISVTILAGLLSPTINDRSVLLLAPVLIWATRLGTFLFGRIQKAGKDARFGEIKVSFLHFLMMWALQGLIMSIPLRVRARRMTCDGWTQPRRATSG